MFRYHFGLSLDGAPAMGVDHGLASAICGPESLLAALETSLGIPPCDADPLQRALAYHDALATAVNPMDFFAKSFACDPLATARLLLSWRDSLEEGGWSADLDHRAAPPRLRRLAEIESAFFKSGHAGTTHAARIAVLRGELAAGAQLPIDSLVVTDPRETLPACWVGLLDELGARYDDPAGEAVLAATASSLGFVQARCWGEGVEAPRERESLRIVSAATSEAAAAALAAQVAALDSGTTVLIADPAERDFLNRQLATMDVALTTSRIECAAALLELPALLLRCRLAPLNPQAWIEFLLHPVSPLPFKLRHELAKNIHDRPGFGPHWRAALETCVERASDAEAATRLNDAYAQWIGRPLLDAAVLTGGALADEIDLLRQWVAQCANAKSADHANDAADWQMATREIARLVALLRTRNGMSRLECARLLAEWRQTCAASSRFPGEVGSVTALNSIGQLLTAQDHVIWWRPGTRKLGRRPWSPIEFDWLASHGVHLPDDVARALADEKCAMRAVLLARKSLTIYHVSRSAGEPTEQSGIVTLLLAQCGESIQVAARELIPCVATARRPLAPLRRWWNLGLSGVLPAREVESYSSIAKLISFPVDWVLEYRAKLAQGPISGFRISDDFLRAGSLLHAAAERLLTDPSFNWRTATESAVHQFVADLFPALLASHGALYLTEGNEAARSRLQQMARRGLWRLIEVRRNAMLAEVLLEHAVEPVPFIGGKIGGRIDLIGRRADGGVAVIDLKLGGKSSRQEELRNNRHLQLATYGYLLSQTGVANPATAYFIFSAGGDLLTRNQSFFPGVEAVSCKLDHLDSDWQHCWLEFEQIYQWRRTQLDDGLIEVPVPGTLADNPPPIDRWAPPKDGNRYSVFLNLTGFPPNA